MLKKYKFTIILTTLVCLLPMLAGLILWDQLPEEMPIHWNVNGEIDNYGSKAFIVYGFPAILAGFQLICVFASSLDPKHKNYDSKVFTLVLWITPVLSLVLEGFTYSVALGYDGLNIGVIMCVLVGLMFILMGNYLPKCRQSYTMGIKLPWTLNDEGNWNATHRFGGWVWTICGVVMLATAFLAMFWILTGVLIVAVSLPTIYSYLYYRKHKTDEE